MNIDALRTEISTDQLARGYTGMNDDAIDIDVSTGIALTMNTASTPTLSGWLCWEEI